MPKDLDHFSLTAQVEKLIPEIAQAIRTTHQSVKSELGAFKAETFKYIDQNRLQITSEIKLHMKDFFQYGLDYCNQLDIDDIINNSININNNSIDNSSSSVNNINNDNNSSSNDDSNVNV